MSSPAESTNIELIARLEPTTPGRYSKPAKNTFKAFARASEIALRACEGRKIFMGPYGEGKNNGVAIFAQPGFECPLIASEACKDIKDAFAKITDDIPLEVRQELGELSIAPLTGDQTRR